MSKGFESRKPTVNEVNEFLEIASDFEDPLELIREALSNSYDARATHVEIRIDELDDGRTRIQIEDDGEGMNESELSSFFDLGNSPKDDTGIGYKGHGTKIYYKSDQITVQTAKNGNHHRAVMDNPWDRLNNRELPTYRVESRPGADESYTRIEIIGFGSGRAFSERRLTYNRLDHYINWKTIGGSLAPHLDKTSRPMEIHVELDDAFDTRRGQLDQQNHFEFPEERTDIESTDDVDKLCKHYPPKQHELTVDGEKIRVDIVGFVAGRKAREELPTFGKHSSQFGVWLAKDHIKVERVNEVIGSAHEPSQFFFVANCQALELSANRETVRNKASATYEALVDFLERFMVRVTQNQWYTRYIEARRAAEFEKSVSSQANSITDRKEQIRTSERNEPTNNPELLVALTDYAVRNNLTQQVVDYAPNEDIQAIVATDDGLNATALVTELHQLFEKERAVSKADNIVCWRFGDLDYLHQLEQDGYLGRDISFILRGDTPRCILDGVDIPIIELGTSLSTTRY